jgi:mitogen-activated protein kinase kinase kinase
MLASKSPYPTPSLGGSSSQASAQYNSSISSYRAPGANARADHSMFASPTESEFSEIYDAPDAVRYARLPHLQCLWLLTCSGIGMKTRLPTG